VVAALKEEEAQLTAALARAYASRSAEASELGGAPTEDARPAQHPEAQHPEADAAQSAQQHPEADAAQSAQQHPEADALGQQLERVFEKLALCDADGAAARASTILAGLGFTAAMQAQVLYADVC
jgi:hypothetical protein